MISIIMLCSVCQRYILKAIHNRTANHSSTSPVVLNMSKIHSVMVTLKLKIDAGVRDSEGIYTTAWSNANLQEPTGGVTVVNSTKNRGDVSCAYRLLCLLSVYQKLKVPGSTISH